jgi:hypothetical protein
MATESESRSSYVALRKAHHKVMTPAIGRIDSAQGDSVASRLPIVISVTFAADIVYGLFGQLR